MLSPDSPFLNIPARLDRREAVFLDGLRHSYQIAELAYIRLCAGLAGLATGHGQGQSDRHFTPVFLDAWAFVDAADRFRCLWEMQSASESMPAPYSPVVVRAKLSDVRALRNVQAHLAQKIDQVVALNSSALGSLSWLTVFSREPLRIKTCFIRPGVLAAEIKDRFLIPEGNLAFFGDVGHVWLRAGKHAALLSDAYRLVCDVVAFADASLRTRFSDPLFAERWPSDMIGTAELAIDAASPGNEVEQTG